MRNLILLTLFAIAVSGCKEDSPEEILADDIAKIQADLAAKNLTATATPSGIHYILSQPGSSEHPVLSSTVTVKYKGTFLDGTVFDETMGSETASFPLTGVIEGWQEAIPLLGKTGKGTFWIPSGLCYGPSGRGSIPPNAVLVFEVELIDFF